MRVHGQDNYRYVGLTIDVPAGIEEATTAKNEIVHPPMHLNELSSPVPVVDYDIASRNIRRLQQYCDTHQFRLRPHIKTHKLPFFAHEQCKAGAIGITVQKIGEAEVMAQTGLADILITYNIVGREKAERLANLTNFARLSVAIDNERALESLGWAARRASTPIRLSLATAKSNPIRIPNRK